jgi:hypothetical protein
MIDRPQPISQAALREALEAAAARVAGLEREIAAKVGEMEEAKSEENLLRQLLRVRGQEEGSPPADPDSPKAHSAAAHPIVEEVIRELEDAGRPLHISELMDRLQGRGVRIPGRGKPANVIAHLSRDSRIVRPSRGIYALGDWKLSAPAVPATRRRVRGNSKAEGKDR